MTEAVRRFFALALPITVIATGVFILGVAITTGVATFREGGNADDGLGAASNALPTAQGGERSKPAGQAVARKTKRAPESPRIPKRYVVRRGDTLWEIAVKRYGTAGKGTIARIKKQNGIRGAGIRPGQVLILPGKG